MFTLLVFWVLSSCSGSSGLALTVGVFPEPDAVSNTEHRTRNDEHGTTNTERRTRNDEHGTTNLEVRTSNRT